ncbi:MAG: GNAT family N-acetyltransferase [bacterium]|nr:GNAT family N-acetyltransferase [bacterium]
MDSSLEELQELVCSEAPQPADVIVWLQGGRFTRGPKVIELYRQGHAAHILISGNDIRQHTDKPDEIFLDDLVAWLEERGVDRQCITVDPYALHTRDQAVRVLSLARQQGWNRIILVGARHHQLRAFLTFLRHAQEIGWSGRIMNQPALTDWDTIPDGGTQTTRELFEREIEKMAQYREHVTSTAEGLLYMQNASTQFGQKTHLRPAAFCDAQFLWFLRNQPDVYQYFKTPLPVTWEAHTTWVTPRFLGLVPSTLYVIMYSDVPVGQARADFAENGEASISISLLQAFRGRGIAINSLRLLMDLLEQQGVLSVLAEVHVENLASQKLFNRSPFIVAEQEGSYIRYRASLADVEGKPL